MNKTATAILWLGVLFIVLAVVAHWTEISQILFGSRGSSQIQQQPGYVIPSFTTPQGAKYLPQTSPGPKKNCPPGYVYNASTGTCVMQPFHITQ